jgi:hypothetical protein
VDGIRYEVAVQEKEFQNMLAFMKLRDQVAQDTFQNFIHPMILPKPSNVIPKTLEDALAAYPDPNPREVEEVNSSLVFW